MMTGVPRESRSVSPSSSQATCRSSPGRCSCLRCGHARVALADSEKRALSVPRRDFLGGRHYAALGSRNDLDSLLDRLRKELPDGRAGPQEKHPTGTVASRAVASAKPSAPYSTITRRSSRKARARRRCRCPVLLVQAREGESDNIGPGGSSCGKAGGRATANASASISANREQADPIARMDGAGRAPEKDRAASLTELFAVDPSRAERFSIEAGELMLDYSKHRVDAEAMRLLAALAAQAQLPTWIARMFGGEPINSTEARAVLHVALRSDDASFPEGRDVMSDVRGARERMRRFVGEAHGGVLKGADGRAITDIVNIGIGGSDLGPGCSCGRCASSASPARNCISSPTSTRQTSRRYSRA